MATIYNAEWLNIYNYNCCNLPWMKKTHFENQKLELFMLNVTIIVVLNKNVGRFTQKVDTRSLEEKNVFSTVLCD
jgi:hypothetical protein